MSYWVLFFIIAVVIMVGGTICAILLDKYCSGGLILIIPMIFLAIAVIYVGIPLSLHSVKEYSHNEYDLEAIYNEYESTPGCTCKKITKEINSCSTESEITVETLVGGKKKVRYITYIPSKKALDEKAEEEKMETFRLQKDTENEPLEKAEISRNEEK